MAWRTVVKGVADWISSREWVQGALLAIVVFSLYVPSLSAGFLWDDELLFTANPVFLTPEPWRQIWLTTAATDYYPVTWSLFYLEWRLFGPSPAGYHCVNILLHVIGVLCTWQVLKRLPLPAPWLAALVFAVHPVNVASVSWVSQGKNTLSLIFYAATAWCYLRFDEVVAKGSGRGTPPASAGNPHAPDPARWLLASLFFFALAVLSKSSGILLPVALLAISAWRHGRLNRVHILAIVPFLAVTAGMSLCTIWFQHHRAMGGATWTIQTWDTRLMIAGWVFWFYALHVFVPVRMMAVYPLGVVHATRGQLILPPFGALDATNALAWLPDLALLACFVLLWRARGAWGRSLLLALVYTTAMLLPVMGFVEMFYMRYSIVSDHLQYLASIGFVALGVAGWHVLARRAGAAATGLATVVVVGLAVISWQYQGTYHSAESLWRDTLRKNPDASVAHFNLGSILEEQKQFAQAVEHYREALKKSSPDRAMWYNMGHALSNLGRTREAIDCYRESLRLDPTYPEAYNNLGVLLDQVNEREMALRAYQAALLYHPDYPEAHNNAGKLLYDMGRPDEAIRHLRSALALKPHGNPQACGNLGRVLLEKGAVDEAYQMALLAIRSGPDYADGYRTLGLVLLRQARYGEAAAALKRAGELGPRDAEICLFQGVVAERQGNAREALEHYRAAADLNPQDALAYNNQAWILATSGQEGVRDREVSLRLARHACLMTRNENALYLDTLAAALAVNGQFGTAIEVATDALARAERSGDQDLAANLRRRIEAYRASKPWTE